MDEGALSAFGDTVTVLYRPELVDDRSALLQACGDADALIVRNRTQVDEALVAASPSLVVIGRLGVGLDNIDLKACDARGIAVRPATGANTLSVAEYVISVTLSLTRRAYGSSTAMIAGDWPRNTLIGGEIAGRAMGLIGFGEIARAVADRAAALGMTIFAHDPYIPDDDAVWQSAERCTVDQIIERSDVVSLHVPLTPDTKNMIGREALARMKPDALLINTARGGIVDEAALALALQEHRLGGAALDVFEAEPLTAEAAAKFAGLDNLILTPHIAGVTQPGNVRVSSVTVANVIEELARRSQ